MSAQSALPRINAGRRLERIEYGIRHVPIEKTRPTVEIRPLADCRDIIARVAAGERLGWFDPELVTRTVTTYTTDWVEVPASPGDGEPDG